MLVSTVIPNKPKRLKGLSQKASSLARVLLSGPTRTNALPVYRANLNHPVKFTEHGNAASPARPRDRADLTTRRVRGRSIGRTEEANASGNALDMPTSVWSEMVGQPGEPAYPRKANDDRRLSVDASWRCCLNGAQRSVAAGRYYQAARPRFAECGTAGPRKAMAVLMRA
jgi:hypothetical protein